MCFPITQRGFPMQSTRPRLDYSSRGRSSCFFALYVISPAQLHRLPSFLFCLHTTNTPQAPGFTGCIFFPHLGQQNQSFPLISFTIYTSRLHNCNNIGSDLCNPPHRLIISEVFCAFQRDPGVLYIDQLISKDVL